MSRATFRRYRGGGTEDDIIASPVNVRVSEALMGDKYE